MTRHGNNDNVERGVGFLPLPHLGRLGKQGSPHEKGRRDQNGLQKNPNDVKSEQYRLLQ
jgi:hypothetical protein